MRRARLGWGVPFSMETIATTNSAPSLPVPQQNQTVAMAPAAKRWTPAPLAEVDMHFVECSPKNSSVALAASAKAEASGAPY